MAAVLCICTAFALTGILLLREEKKQDSPAIAVPGQSLPDSIIKVFYHQGIACYETENGDVYICAEDGNAYKLSFSLSDVYCAEGSKIICHDNKAKAFVLFDLVSGEQKVLTDTAGETVTSACIYNGRLYYTCFEPFGGKLKSVSLTDLQDVREELPSQIIIKITPSDKGIICVTGELESTYTLREDTGLLESSFTMLTGVALLDKNGVLHTLLEPADMGYTFPGSCRIAVEDDRYIFAVTGKFKNAVWGTIE